MHRRTHRVLVVAGFLATVAELWPSPARATISCKVQYFRACGLYLCCIQSCLICIDSQTGDTTLDCSDPICYNKND
jgi:hypothetical protein